MIKILKCGASEMFVSLNIIAFGEPLSKCVFRFVFTWISGMIIMLLGILLGHLEYIIIYVGSGGSRFYIDIHQSPMHFCTYLHNLNMYGVWIFIVIMCNDLFI